MKEIFHNPTGKEMHFDISEKNKVEWETLPEGEKGETIIFPSPDEAIRFVNDYARLKGYKK